MKCRTCGTTLSAGALLCGECGTSVIAPRPTLGDTAHHDRRALRAALAARTPPAGTGAPPAVSGRRPAPLRQPTSAAATAPAVESSAPPTVAMPQPHPQTPAQAQPQTPSQPHPEAPAPAAPRSAATPTTPPPAPRRRGRRAAAADPAAPGRPHFHLAFSTGETVRVAAGGLIGRNPTPGPGETADYLVQIVDPDRSVSKTHLEFAVDGDEFWVRDRASTNGTRILSQGGATDGPDLAPNEWTRVHRGSRVAMGDHHFDLA